MKKKVYICLNLLLSLVLILMPVMDVYANQYQHCDTQDENPQVVEATLNASPEKAHCHQSQTQDKKCCCDTDQCDCASISHAFIPFQLNEKQSFKTISSQVRNISSHLRYVYIPSGLRPPIA